MAVRQDAAVMVCTPGPGVIETRWVATQMHPPKTNMVHLKNEPLEEEIPIQNHHFLGSMLFIFFPLLKWCTPVSYGYSMEIDPQAITRWWQLKYWCIFTPILGGRWNHFDDMFSNRLVQPPTRFFLRKMLVGRPSRSVVGIWFLEHVC